MIYSQKWKKDKKQNAQLKRTKKKKKKEDRWKAEGAVSGSTREPRPPGTSQGSIERETEAANRDTGQESNRGGPGHQGELRPHYCSDNEI